MTEKVKNNEFYEFFFFMEQNL